MSERRRTGRPRDPAVSERALAAAREVYAERGWSGFTPDEVARRAGIGKGSIYRRWRGKASLLVAALRGRVPFLADIDTGELRADLVEFGTRWYDYVRYGDGAMLLRMRIEAQFTPELHDELARDPYPDYIRATRAIVHRGIDRGELPPDTSVAVIADLVAGAVFNHAHTRMPNQDQAPQAISAYVAQLVDTVLTGARDRPSGPPA